MRSSWSAMGSGSISSGCRAPCWSWRSWTTVSTSSSPPRPVFRSQRPLDLVGQLGLHALTDPVHLGHRLLLQGAPQDRAAQRDEGLGEPLATRHRTRAQQGLALPDLGVLGVISLERAQRGDEKTLVPRGTQAGVDLVADALGSGGLKSPAELLGEPYEGGLGLEDPVLVGALHVEEEDHVEIAAVGELAASELAHSHHQEVPALDVPGGLRAGSGQLPGRQSERLLEAYLGHLGEGHLGLGRADLLGQIEETHVDELATLEQAQGRQRELGIVAALRRAELLEDGGMGLAKLAPWRATAGWDR